MQRSLLLVLAITTFLGCGDPNIEPLKEEPEVDKAAFAASLVAGFKFWRFEELTVEHPDSTKTINLRPDPTGVIPGIPGLPFLIVVHTGYSFHNNGKFVNDLVDGGPFGNIPYGDDSISIFIPGSADSYTGSWYWDETRETVAIEGPLSAFGYIIKTISPKKVSPEVGYLDKTAPPRYKTVKQAIAGASPDRIRIIFYEDDPAIGTTKYVFTMRAAWVTKVVYDRLREQIYEVLY